MKKLAIAVVSSLVLASAAFAGDLGAPQTGPSYKPSSVALVFAGVAAAALAPASVTVLGVLGIWGAFFGTAYANEEKK